MIESPLRDPQDALPAAWCDKCRQEIYHGETRYRWEGQWLCPECFRDALNSTDLWTLAADMGLETKEV